MRKKSKKKQIVAMTLALSVLSSSVGMCGASAAEALSDTDDSGLQVTVVPLANSNADTDTPSNADTDTPADDTTPKEQPAVSTGDSTNQITDGDGDATGDNDTSSDDKPTIERPEQSETVETLPGTAEDNKDHIKGEDKDDTEDKGETGEETPGTGDTDTGDTEEKGEEGSGSEETPEEKPEETPKEDDTDYSCAYDPKSGHFKITFNIKEDAEGDQTIELSKVQEVVEKYGEKQFDEWLQTDKGASGWMTPCGTHSTASPAKRPLILTVHLTRSMSTTMRKRIRSASVLLSPTSPVARPCLIFPCPTAPSILMCTRTTA